MYKSQSDLDTLLSFIIQGLFRIVLAEPWDRMPLMFIGHWSQFLKGIWGGKYKEVKEYLKKKSLAYHFMDFRSRQCN